MMVSRGRGSGAALLGIFMLLSLLLPAADAETDDGPRQKLSEKNKGFRRFRLQPPSDGIGPVPSPDIIDIAGVLKSLDIDLETLDALIAPTEDKVNWITDEAISLWKNARHPDLTEQMRERLVQELENTRGLALEQVCVYRRMLTLKAQLELRRSGMPMRLQQSMKQEMGMLRARFWLLSEQQKDIFMGQQDLRDKYLPELVQAFNLKTTAVDQILSFRNQWILSRFEPFL